MIRALIERSRIPASARPQHVWPRGRCISMTAGTRHKNEVIHLKALSSPGIQLQSHLQKSTGFSDPPPSPGPDG